MKGRKIVYAAIAAFFAVLVVLAALPSGGGGNTGEYEYIRIHVRANGNGEADQRVKLKVKEEVVAYLTPFVAECRARADAYAVIERNLDGITSAALRVLRANGFTYGAEAKLLSEYFPARAYDGITLESGYYDALILYLGSGAGDNWWCVLYPPLCFIESEYAGGEGIRYRSKLIELIRKIVGNG